MRNDPIAELKEAKILDILRRVLANPQNAPEVARVLALDWHPKLIVNASGKITIWLPGEDANHEYQ